MVIQRTEPTGCQKLGYANARRQLCQNGPTETEAAREAKKYVTGGLLRKWGLRGVVRPGRVKTLPESPRLTRLPAQQVFEEPEHRQSPRHGNVA
jgi:hypothetical protein